MGAGYPPPPGAYPGAYQPPPAAPQGPATVKIIIGVLVALLVVIIGVGAYFLTRGKTYDINVSPPPGYEEASQEMLDEFKETMSESSEDIEVNELFVDSTQSNFIIVASMDIPPSLTDNPPSGDDPEEMEDWFYEHEEEWQDAFSGGLVEGMGGTGASLDSDTFEVERLATGDAVLHMATTVSVMNASFTIDTLWIIKGNSAFFMAVMGLNPGSDTAEYLKNNVSFE
jgi:hypothetical protein